MSIWHPEEIIDREWGLNLTNLTITFTLPIQVSHVPDFLSTEEDSDFIQEQIEEMGGECFCMVGVELIDKLVDVVESFHSLAVHLLLDFVKNLIRFVFPIHLLSYKNIINIFYR